MVVQEKLTYVHTHAKLSLDVTLAQIEKVDLSKGFQNALRRLIVATRDHYKERVGAVIPNDKSEPVLESMVAYLLKNGVPTGIVEMCLYEQFSLPGLDNAGQHASVVRNHAEKTLEEMKSKRLAEADVLKEWHQTYHLYRVAVNCLIGAIGSYKNERYEEALDLFIVSYHVNEKVLKKNLLGEFKGLRVLSLVKCVAQSLVRVNEVIVNQLKTGERLDEVKIKLHELVCPAVNIHQQCDVSKNDALTRKIFESVLETWCMLPGGSEMSKEVQDFVSDAFSVLFEAPPMPKEKSFKNRDHIDLSVDHQLSKLYRQAMQEVQAIVGQVDY